MYYGVKASDIRKKWKDRIPSDATELTYETDQKRPLIISRQKVGYGERWFLVCPDCGKRFEILYLVQNVLVCWKCGGVPVYWGIQNSTKGGYYEIQYRMERFAKKHKIAFTYPFDYFAFIFDKRNGSDSFRMAIKIMQSLENMRFQSIIYSTTYTSETIRSVLSGEHPLLKNNAVTLANLKECFYNW